MIRPLSLLALCCAIPVPVVLAPMGALDVSTALAWAVLVVVATYAASVGDTIEAGDDYADDLTGRVAPPRTHTPRGER